MTAIFQHLSRTLTLPNEAGITDGALLEGYIRGRDEAAFAALVRRHGPMVWRVCRRILFSHHDAEDAFQATFFVLARKAATVAPPQMVANWLYGVAHQTALNARASTIRRGMRERQLKQMPEPALGEPAAGPDLRFILDRELRYLPDKYRAAIVLCDLEGRTRKDVAQQLGVPEGTLSGHLTRGRALLAKRLGRRGLGLSVAAVATALAQQAASGSPPVGLLSATIRNACLHMAGQVAVSAIASTRVAALADGVARSLVLTKLKAAAVVLLLASAAGLAATGLVHHASSAAPTAHDQTAVITDSQTPKPTARLNPVARRQPDYTRGKDTTFITGPVDRDGDVDYETALNERLNSGINPETNANASLWKILGPRPDKCEALPEYFHRLRLPVPPEHGAYFIGSARYASEALKLAPGRSTDTFLNQLSQATRQPWHASSCRGVAAWLRANEKPLAAIIEATRKPQFYNPLVSRKSGAEGWYGLVGALLPGVQGCQDVATALTARAMRQTEEGKFDAAWQDLLACHRLGRLLARNAEPTVFLAGLAIDQRARVADLRLLQRASPKATNAQVWLRDFEQLPPLPSAADWYDLGGRYMYLDSVLHLRRHGDRFLRLLVAIDPRLHATTHMPDVAPQPGFAVSLDWDSILRTGNSWYERMAAAHRIGDRAAREKEFDRIGDALGIMEKDAGSLRDVRHAIRARKETPARLSQRLGNALVGFYFQGFRRVRRAADQAEQWQRNSRLALALAAYRADHGRYPAHLEPLVPRYLERIPGDLFSGKALSYRLLAAGYLLQSVGNDVSFRMPLPDLKQP